MLASFGSDIGRISGYCYANELPIGRHYIKNKAVKIAAVRCALTSFHEKKQDRKSANQCTDYYVSRRTKKDMILHLFSHLSDAAKSLPRSGYCMGEHKTIYVSGVKISEYSTCEEYTGGRWKARHGEISIFLTISEAKRTRVIGGIITIVGDLVRRGLRTCEWIESGKGYNEIITKTGYLAGDYHFTAHTVKEAKAIAGRYYKEKRERELKERRYAAALKRSDKRTWVTYEDSRKGGNCVTGTHNFAHAIRFNLENTGAIRADFLIKKASQHNVVTFAERAVKAAKMRYAGIA